MTVENQKDNLQMWVLLNPEEEMYQQRQFRLVGTGRPISESKEDLEYIGTVQQLNGHLIFHLFEIAYSERGKS